MLTLISILVKRWLAMLWVASLIVGIASLAVALNDGGLNSIRTIFHMQTMPMGGSSNSGITSRYAIIEGERFGSIALGMSVDDVRRQLGKPFSSASREFGEVTRYDWDNNDSSSWSVFVDTKSGKIVALLYVPFIETLASFLHPGENRDEVETKLNNVQFETRKGARYGHTVGTIEALYGKPPQVFFEPGHGVFTYYYPEVGTEFLFDCLDKWDSKKPCSEYSEVLEQIRIYARTWSPVRVWGQSYGRH